jgi:hypothetical protein
MGPGRLDQEPRLAGPDLDLELRLPSEDLLRDEGASDPRLLVR